MCNEMLQGSPGRRLDDNVVVQSSPSPPQTAPLKPAHLPIVFSHNSEICHTRFINGHRTVVERHGPARQNAGPA